MSVFGRTALLEGRRPVAAGGTLGEVLAASEVRDGLTSFEPRPTNRSKDENNEEREGLTSLDRNPPKPFVESFKLVALPPSLERKLPKLFL